MEIFDSSGQIVRVLETFSDKTGMFKVDNFRIPNNAEDGEWKIKVSSGENTHESAFFVISETSGISVFTQEPTKSHKTGGVLTIFGKDARVGASVFLTISDSSGIIVDNLILQATNNGEFYSIWIIPGDLGPGTYTIKADDEVATNTTSFIIN